MKKLIVLILTICMCITLTACSSDTTDSTEPQTNAIEILQNFTNSFISVDKDFSEQLNALYGEEIPLNQIIDKRTGNVMGVSTDRIDEFSDDGYNIYACRMSYYYDEDNNQVHLPFIDYLLIPDEKVSGPNGITKDMEFKEVLAKLDLDKICNDDFFDNFRIFDNLVKTETDSLELILADYNSEVSSNYIMVYQSTIPITKSKDNLAYKVYMELVFDHSGTFRYIDCTIRTDFA